MKHFRVLAGWDGGAWKIYLIKALRIIFMPLGLKEAKDLAETLEETGVLVEGPSLGLLIACVRFAKSFDGCSRELTWMAEDYKEPTPPPTFNLL
jgi:hypothetical protein